MNLKLLSLALLSRALLSQPLAFVDRYSGAVASPGYTSGASSLVVTNATGLPSGSTYFYLLVKAEGANTDELFLVTSRTGTTLTVAGAQSGTSASNHATGAQIFASMMTAGAFAQLKKDAVIGPYEARPALIDSGDGTEASPWTHADNSAGIQTALTSLATRGGLVTLNAGRYDLSSAVTITQASAVIAGEAAGFGPDNAEAESLTGAKIRRATTGNVFAVGSALSTDRPGAVTIRDLFLWGSSRAPGSSPYQSNAAINFSGYTDQAIVTGVKIASYGVGLYLSAASTWLDAAAINLNAIHGNGYGIYFGTGTSWFSTIAQNQISDNDYHAIYANSSGDPVDHNILRGNTVVRNCRVSGCSTNPANIYWDRNYTLIEHNTIQNAGVCLDGSPNCPGGGASRLADELYIAGDGNVISGNFLGRTTPFSGASCIKISGDNNSVNGNTFQNCETDISVASGAADTHIDQPGATISDSGTRTVINGVGSNAGDPDTTGDWNGVTKWAGLIIRDTSNDIRYLYHTTTLRTIIDGGAGGGTAVSAARPYLTIGGVKYVAATGHQATLPPTSPTWINSVAPTVTAGTNGDSVVDVTNINVWQIGGATSSVECEFQFSTTQQSGGSQYPGAGIYIYDSTNSRIWWFHAFVFTNAGSTDNTGIQLAMETWTYTGSGNPSFSGSTNKHFPSFGGGPLHLKLSVASTTITAAASFNGGATFTTFDTATVGTIAGGGYALGAGTPGHTIMDVYSLIVN